MDKKAKLIEIANENLDIFKKGQYINKNGEIVDISSQLKASIDGTILYKPNMLEILIHNNNTCFGTKIEVTGETTFEAAKRLKEEGYSSVVSLNFASARTPGGGFLKGSVAQEESLARASGLYPTISQNSVKEMYDMGRESKTALYPNYMIYSPNVPVFRDEKGDFLDEMFTTSVITAAAPNAGVIRERERENIKKIDSTIETRIRGILRVSLSHGNTSIVLGAFGCGVFKNNPYTVAYTFRNLLHDSEFKNQFKRIVFAIYDKTPNKDVFKSFKSVLGTK